MPPKFRHSRRADVRIALAITPVLGLTSLTATKAGAHDRWVDGAPIPDWVKQYCCGQADAHHLQPFQVHATPAGFKIDGYGQIIPESTLMRSPDGEWWVFYHEVEPGVQSQVFCFFGPIPRS